MIRRIRKTTTLDALPPVEPKPESPETIPAPPPADPVEAPEVETTKVDFGQSEPAVATHVVRPGYLVMLRSTLKGGVWYDKRDLDTGKTEEQLIEEAQQLGSSMPDVKVWQTTRTITDPTEHARGTKARSEARSRITKACIATSFGLICPAERVAELDQATREAKAIEDEFNESAKVSRLRVYVLKGRIAGTDEEASRAIVAEVRDLLDDMNDGIKALDPDAIREAADKAARMGAMLEAEQSEKVAKSVEEARKAARIIVKRVKKGGESGSEVLAEIQRGQIEKARFAFLDLDTSEKPEEERMPQVELQRFDLDIDGEEAAQ